MYESSSSPLQPRQRQIDGLQVLRAVAVVLVAWFHTFEGLEARFNSTLGIYGIDIFFAISGFIISTTILGSRTSGPNAARIFLKRRFIRIFPIYWVFVAIALFRTIAAHLRHKDQFAHTFLADTLTDVFLLPLFHYPHARWLVAFSWTLVFEVFFYCLLGLLLLLTTRRAVPVVIVLLCTTVALGTCIDIRHPLLIIFANPILLEFAIGAIIALLYQRFGPQPTVGRCLIVSGVAATIGLRFLHPAVALGARMVVENELVLPRVFTWGIAAAAIVAGVIFCSSVIESRFGKLCVALGNASYSTYLISGLVVESTLRLLASRGFHGPGLSLIMQLTAQTLITFTVLALGWLCYQLIEWPMLRWLQARLIAGRSNRAPQPYYPSVPAQSPEHALR